MSSLRYPYLPSRLRALTIYRHVAQLEKKLDDLVTLLTAPKGQGEHIEQPHLAESVSPLRSTSPISAHQTRQVPSFPERIPGRQMGLDSLQRIMGAFSSTVHEVHSVYIHPKLADPVSTYQIRRIHFFFLNFERH